MKELFRREKVIARALVEKNFVTKRDLSVPKTRFGSDYGGWDVADGKLESMSTVYCFGVGEDTSFDLALIDTFGLIVYAFDPYPAID